MSTAPLVCARCGRIGGPSVIGARLDSVEGPAAIRPMQLSAFDGTHYTVQAPARYVVVVRCRGGCRA